MILNDEQKMIQDMMRNYSQQKLKPTAALRDKTAQFPAAIAPIKVFPFSLLNIAV